MSRVQARQRARRRVHEYPHSEPHEWLTAMFGPFERVVRVRADGGEWFGLMREDGEVVPLGPSSVLKHFDGFVQLCDRLGVRPPTHVGWSSGVELVHCLRRCADERR